jgi:hypothetical protein
MTLSPCGKCRLCFIGVTAKGCQCDLVVASALAGGQACRCLRDHGGPRRLVIARHPKSSKVLGVVFGYVSLRI